LQIGIKELHEKFIKKAISLAGKAKGKTSPNPLVGAIIVKNGQVIGSGYHKKAGHPHAEINAIKNAKEPVKNAALYINLEPCCHHGKTPPCTDTIIKSGIKQVYIGMVDPNPLVAGSGVKKLKAHGLKVVTGILKDECEKLNESYIKFITKKIPFVILKTAATLDGRTATASGDSKWITNEKSRSFVHKLRSGIDAVLVGSATATKDNPNLTVRLGGKKLKNPVRVVLDRTLKISKNANVLKDMAAAKTIIFTGKGHDKKKAADITKKGAKIIAVSEKDGGLNLKKVLKSLAQKNITSVLVEGGSELCSSFVKEGLADKMYLFFAPKLLLDEAAKPIFTGKGFKGKSKGLIKDAINVKLKRIKRFGDDVMVEFYF
jgi:diaminohydroxyphosphoribosylaminopyrimidine deaminase/5-amino-6-(5-phosphoribosylamino)uracil reductase